jgi:hypothetical protein
MIHKPQFYGVRQSQVSSRLLGEEMVLTNRLPVEYPVAKLKASILELCRCLFSVIPTA